VPPDTIFFLYLTGKKTGAKGKQLNIKSSIQSGAGGQHPRYKTRESNSYRSPTTPL